jgi:hypothetical protein
MNNWRIGFESYPHNAVKGKEGRKVNVITKSGPHSQCWAVPPGKNEMIA